MKTYNLKLKETAEADIHGLFGFLIVVMSQDGANRYIDTMMNEVRSLSILADLYSTSRYADILKYHPEARHMVSHNKRWVYVFHIDDDTVVVDRIIPSKLITK